MSEFCVVFTMSLCGLKTSTNKLAISILTALIFSLEVLRNNLKLTYKYQISPLANTKVSISKDYGESYMNT